MTFKPLAGMLKQLHTRSEHLRLRSTVPVSIIPMFLVGSRRRGGCAINGVGYALPNSPHQALLALDLIQSVQPFLVNRPGFVGGHLI